MLAIDCREIIEEIVEFIKISVAKTGLKKLIIGLSGGVDSSVVTFLTTKALGKNNVLIALMPYGNLCPQDLADAKIVIKTLGISSLNIFKIDIKKTVNQIVSAKSKMDKIRKGNIITRVRMIYLFDLAKKNRALVCGTENRTEYLLGYYTRFGDEASDIEPIRHLYKTQVWQLAKYLGVPEKIIKKKPTAGLWAKQTDEEELGFSYKEADMILHLYFDKKLSKKGIVNYGIKGETVEKVLSWMKKNEFKHSVPYSLDK
jgi:NAD+ synthase